MRRMQVSILRGLSSRILLELEAPLLIERHSKPLAVLVPWDKWEQWQATSVELKKIAELRQSVAAEAGR